MGQPRRIRHLTLRGGAMLGESIMVIGQVLSERGHVTAAAVAAFVAALAGSVVLPSTSGSCGA